MSHSDVPRVFRSSCKTLVMTEGHSGPPRYAWAVAIMCFGAAMVLVAVLLYVSHPQWF